MPSMEMNRYKNQSEKGLILFDNTEIVIQKKSRKKAYGSEGTRNKKIENKKTK